MKIFLLFLVLFFGCSNIPGKQFSLAGSWYIKRKIIMAGSGLTAELYDVIALKVDGTCVRIRLRIYHNRSKEYEIFENEVWHRYKAEFQGKKWILIGKRFPFSLFSKSSWLVPVDQLKKYDLDTENILVSCSIHREKLKKYGFKLWPNDFFLKTP